jgi:hypothetical protein
MTARAHPGDRFLCIDRSGHDWAELGDAATAPFRQRAVALCNRCGLAVEYALAAAVTSPEVTP